MLTTRLTAACAGVLILVLGLVVRALAEGAFAKYAGVALYAALIYALVVACKPSVAATTAAPISLAFCWAVEFAQLTPGPAALSARSTLARLVLGSTFNVPDLIWYAVGVLAMLGVHRLAARQAVRD